MPIEKGLIGVEDINFGTSTYQRKSQSGSFITMTQLRALHIPIVDSAGRFTDNNVESALAECMLREESGSNIKRLTNRSGTERVAGDVVVVDTNNDDSFTTTTTSGDVLALGVVLETIGNNIVGRVAVGGYVTSVKVDGTVIRGQFLKTSVTATKATPVNTVQQGVFAVAMSNGGSVVSAAIIGAYKAASGTVVSSLNADMVDGLHTTILDIGDWNMDITPSVLITHGLDYTKIRSFSAIIRHDGAVTLYPIIMELGSPSSTDGIITLTNSTQFYLARILNGFFDSSSFDSTSFNRGWITVLSVS